MNFVVSETLNNRSDNLKGYTVATRVFGRTADFDAANDPIVSIQANKLRRALERYYLVEGSQDTVRIDIPRVPMSQHLQSSTSLQIRRLKSNHQQTLI